MSSSSPLYRTQYEILSCILLNAVILLVGLFLNGIIVKHFPGFFPANSSTRTIVIIISASVLVWSFFFRVTLFYEDQFVFYYPLRLFFRKKTFHYDDIESVTYGEYLGDNLVLAALFTVSAASKSFDTSVSDDNFFPHLTFQMKNGYKNLCSVRFWNKKKAVKMYYLLRFLKQKGVRIEGFGVINNDVADCTVAKIEMIFGTGEKHIRRHHTDNSNKDGLIELILSVGFLIILIIVVLCFSK